MRKVLLILTFWAWASVPLVSDAQARGRRIIFRGPLVKRMDYANVTADNLNATINNGRAAIREFNALLDRLERLNVKAEERDRLLQELDAKLDKTKELLLLGLELQDQQEGSNAPKPAKKKEKKP